jgi:hypothetical protein
LNHSSPHYNAARLLKPKDPHGQRHSTHNHSLPSSSSLRTDHRSFAEVVRGSAPMAAARYPGDPRARPARAFCAVSATSSIKRRRDELIDKAVVC